MTVFSKSSEVQAWGPISTIDVRMTSLGGGLEKASVLVNMSIGAREIADVRQCFNEMSYIYALGNDQSSCQMSLTFAVFIGRENCRGDENNAKILGKWIDSYEISRITKRKESTNVTIGGFSRTGWITGIDIGDVDALRGICYCTVHFIMELKSQKKGRK